MAEAEASGPGLSGGADEGDSSSKEPGFYIARGLVDAAVCRELRDRALSQVSAACRSPRYHYMRLFGGSPLYSPIRRHMTLLEEI